MVVSTQSARQSDSAAFDLSGLWQKLNQPRLKTVQENVKAKLERLVWIDHRGEEFSCFFSLFINDVSEQETDKKAGCRDSLFGRKSGTCKRLDHQRKNVGACSLKGWRKRCDTPTITVLQ